MATNTTFVQGLYANIFARTPTTSEVNYWTGKIGLGEMTQAQVLEAFVTSGEAQGNAASVFRLYQSYFGRVPAADEVQFHTAALNNGAALITIAQQFSEAPEFATRFGADNTDAEFVTNLYQNVLGRTPSQTEIDYYVARLSGGESRGSVALSFNESPEFKTNYGPETNAALANAGVSDSIPSLDTLEQQGAVSLGTLTNQLITNPDNAFTLTNGTDVGTANIFNAPQVYTPGGDDRINSLQDEDQLTGTGDNPTLNATLGNANDNGAVVVTPTLNGIATVNAAFTGSGGTAVTDLDLQDATGVTTVNITRVSASSNVARIENIQSALAAMSVADSNANNAGVVEFSFGVGVLAGANTGALTLDNVQINTLNIGRNTSGTAATGVALQGYETLSLASTGTANSVNTLNLPMDTGTAGVLTITGDQDLRLGAVQNAVNAANAALLEASNVYTAGTGIAQAGGRIATIDASAFTGNLTIVLDNILDIGKADTSGVLQNVTVTGGTGNDTFVLYDAVQAGDTINGGDGTDTLLFYAGSSIASVATGIENAQFLIDADTAAAIAADFDSLTSVTATTVRNIGSDVVGGVLVNAAEVAATVTMYDMSAAQAAAITVQHSTTGNNQIAQTTVEAAVKANTASDTLGITIAEGLNVDARFNFTIDTVVANTATSTTAATSTIENVTLTDSDSESNSVELQNFAQHTGTITLTGGVAGTFLNLDVDTAGADVTGVTTGVTADAGQVQQGLLGLDTSGTGVDFAAGNIFDVGALATQVRLGAATINAANEASNVIVRVSTNTASAVGAQAITMGSGNDVVIFDNLNDTRGGLTISDTVVGGTGTDTLVLDGNGVRMSLGASEWTNVSGFEQIRLAGNGIGAGATTQYGSNSYNLTLTNDLIDANGGDMITIINDNDVSNDTASGVNTATTGVERGVTIDARTLNAQNHFTYNGEEGIAGVGTTVDRFILSDANANGGNVINGGAMDNVVAGAAIASTDILEVRNTANVTAGDLANISNVGIIAGTNDQATVQTLSLQLNDTVVDAMVDSFHVSTTAEIETLTVRLNAAADITAPPAGMLLNYDASQLTGKSNVNLTLDAVTAVTGDQIQLGMGTTIVNAGAAGGIDTVGTLAAGTADGIILSASQFGIAAGAVGTAVIASGSNIIYGALGTGAVTDRVYVVEGTNLTGGGANDVGIYYDADGSGAGAAVLIGVLVDTGASVLSGAGNTGITVIA